jgi:hypothetical protein
MILMPVFPYVMWVSMAHPQQGGRRSQPSASLVPGSGTTAFAVTIVVVVVVLLCGGLAVYLAVGGASYGRTTPSTGSAVAPSEATPASAALPASPEPATAPASESSSPPVRVIVTRDPLNPPRTYQGRGPTLLRLDPIVREGLVELTHTGGADFTVTALDATGAERDIVDAVGRYEGTRLISARVGLVEIVALRIHADGAWTAAFKSLLLARVWTGPTAEGHGDQVLRLDRPIGGHTPARASHSGEGRFVVTLSGGNADDPAEGRQVRAEDDFSGDFLLKTGTTFVDIRADGAWSLTRY